MPFLWHSSLDSYLGHQHLGIQAVSLMLFRDGDESKPVVWEGGGGGVNWGNQWSLYMFSGDEREMRALFWL